MTRLFELLQKIQAKPGMYIGQASVSDLFMFLAGYKTALKEAGIKATDEEMDFYRNFQPWLQRKYKITTSNSWAKIIMLYCNNEQDGFHNFFELLDDFLQRNQSSDSKEKETARYNV